MEEVQVKQQQLKTMPLVSTHFDSLLPRFHCFWRGDVRNDALELMLLSFLATQRNYTQMMIWTDSPQKSFKIEDVIRMLSQNINESQQMAIKEASNRLTVKYFDPFLDTHSGFENVIRVGVATTAYTDLVRFMVLEEYGGIYVDVDTIFLRDYYPLRNKEFVYPWSNFAKYGVNTAVLSLHRHSELAEAFRDIIIAKGGNLNDMAKNCHPQRLYQEELTHSAGIWSNIEILPIEYFDAYWPYGDGFLHGGGVFAKRNFSWIIEKANQTIDLYEIFPKSFSYHTHAKGTKNTNEQSYFKQYLRMFRQQFIERNDLKAT